MKAKKIVARLVLLIAVCVGIVVIMKINSTSETEAGYIERSEIKVEDGKMTPEVLLSLGRLSDPQVSPDGKHILYGVSYTSIEDNRSCRNLFICDIDGSSREQLSFEGKSIANARWSADGKKIIYLQDGKMYAAEVKKRAKGWKMGSPKLVSDVPAGIGEFKLSPSQDKVMYISYVKSHVDKPGDVYEDLGKATAYSSSDLMYRHWDHWVEEIPHTYVAPINIDSYSMGEGTDILADADGLYELPTEPFGGLEQLDWSPCGNYIAYSCRKKEGKEYAFSTNTGIYLYNVETGETTDVKTDGGYDTEPVFSPDGKWLCWISMERDGYEADKQRLLIAPVEMADGKMKVGEPVEITSSFKYNVAGPSWGAESDRIYFNSLAEGLQGIFAADLCDEGWKISRLTSDSLWYDFGTPFHIYDYDGREILLTTYCSMNFPTEIVSIVCEKDGEDGKYSKMDLVRVTTENDHILSQVAEGETQMRYVKTVDGKDMLTWVLLPPGFDQTKTYPSILICLGGPQGTLSQGWSYRWNYRLMAAQGYVVVLPNRRGTTAFGQEWCEQISGDYCGLNIQDYLSAAREIKAEPYVGKMAACGASYGGWSVYYLCGNHENTFDAFIAHAGIFNQEHMYMSTEEMWFPHWDNGGAPWDENPVAKRHYAHSAHKFIQNWNKPLLVIHGGMDFRVPLEQGMAAFNSAQMMGVPSKLLVFPDENHWILKPQNALFWHREYFNWLDQWLTE